MGRYQRGNQKGVDRRRAQYNDKKQNDKQCSTKTLHRKQKIDQQTLY